MNIRIFSMVSACTLFGAVLHANPQEMAAAISRSTSDFLFSTGDPFEKLRLGQREAEVISLLEPWTLAHARLTYGGTGSGRLYFQLSPTQQMWFEIDNGPRFLVREIGQPEPFGKWTQGHNGEIKFPKSSRSEIHRKGSQKR